jgi:hypothetical protein
MVLIAGWLERTRDIDAAEEEAIVGLPSLASAERPAVSIVARITTPIAALRVCFVMASPSSVGEAGNAGENWQRPIRG